VGTGASSGIGTALARELARHGHDLVLTARRAAPMEALAAALRALGAGATVIPADLSKPGAAAALADDLAALGLDIDILVNNAGLGALGRFDRMDHSRIADMLQVNIIALTELTRLLLPGMIARGHGRAPSRHRRHDEQGSGARGAFRAAPPQPALYRHADDVGRLDSLASRHADAPIFDPARRRSGARTHRYGRICLRRSSLARLSDVSAQLGP